MNALRVCTGAEQTVGGKRTLIARIDLRGTHAPQPKATGMAGIDLDRSSPEETATNDVT